MSDWFPAPVLLSLRDEVNKRFPHRDKASDGIIGDPSHQARVSEHNPCWTCDGKFHGIVRAIDIDSGPDGDPNHDLVRELLNAVIGDPRVWYVISNRIIYSRTYGWRARAYTGTDPHTNHVHISFLFEGCFDTRPFFGTKTPSSPPKISVHKARDEFLRVVNGKSPRQSIDVLRCQRLMNARLAGPKLHVDGFAGPMTLNRWGVLERKYGGTGRPRVPDRAALTRANKGMFQIVD